VVEVPNTQDSNQLTVPGSAARELPRVDELRMRETQHIVENTVNQYLADFATPSPVPTSPHRDGLKHNAEWVVTTPGPTSSQSPSTRRITFSPEPPEVVSFTVDTALRQWLNNKKRKAPPEGVFAAQHPTSRTSTSATMVNIADNT